jgi:hypothetical protein
MPKNRPAQWVMPGTAINRRAFGRRCASSFTSGAPIPDALCAASAGRHQPGQRQTAGWSRDLRISRPAGLAAACHLRRLRRRCYSRVRSHADRRAHRRTRPACPRCRRRSRADGAVRIGGCRRSSQPGRGSGHGWRTRRYGVAAHAARALTADGERTAVGEYRRGAGRSESENEERRDHDGDDLDTEPDGSLSDA